MPHRRRTASRHRFADRQRDDRKVALRIRTRKLEHSPALRPEQEAVAYSLVHRKASGQVGSPCRPYSLRRERNHRTPLLPARGNTPLRRESPQRFRRSGRTDWERQQTYSNTASCLEDKRTESERQSVGVKFFSVFTIRGNCAPSPILIPAVPWRQIFRRFDPVSAEVERILRATRRRRCSCPEPLRHPARVSSHCA